MLKIEKTKGVYMVHNFGFWLLYVVFPIALLISIYMKFFLEKGE
jgi:hypothetical protein